MKELIKIEDSFMLTGRGLVVTPVLPLPKNDRGFKPITDKITIELPDGTQKIFEALFALEHFILVDGGSKWNLVINIKDASKDDVPIGSRIFVNDNMLEKLK